MTAKVKTTTTLFTTRGGNSAFIGREMINWNQDKKKGHYTSIVKETAFTEEEVISIDPQTMEPYVDVNGDPTGETHIERTVEQNLGTRSHLVPFDHVQSLFVAIDETIDPATDNYNDKLHEMQKTALLMDTQAHGLYNTASSDWEIDNF